jgi:ubiquinone/menaquinone biosynthesis C-methylase UbiE
MFEDQSFDVVISSMALHHLPDIESLDGTFGEIARLLKPGGSLYINDLGQLRAMRSVTYFVERARVNESDALAEDYYHSLKAAFSLQEFQAVLDRHLPGRVSLYSTIISPLVIVMTTGARYGIETQLPEIKRLYSVLPPHRKADYRMLKRMLRAGGLPAAF